MFRKPTQYFWVMTVQWFPEPGRVWNAVGYGTSTPTRGQTQRDLFEEVLAHVRDTNEIADGINAVVMFWSLTPNTVA